MLLFNKKTTLKIFEVHGETDSETTEYKKSGSADIIILIII